MRIGRYTVLAPLAKGGMAQVLLAEVEDIPGVRRTVVLKRMLPHLARDENYARMFLDEARILTALNHPNVVQVVEVGREGDELFIAMEHIRGENLAVVQLAAEGHGGLPLPHALHILGGVLAGLHSVHEKRDEAGRPLLLVHRDVTPRNVLVTYEGAVKLIDFGIARAANRLGSTRTGQVRGTAPYMSPEQCRGRQIDRRSDVFSAGILLWELTVGRRLFDEDSEYDVLTRIVTGEVTPPSALVDGYPAPLEAVVMRALKKAPEERFPTAGEFLDALDRAAASLGLAPSARALQGFMERCFAPRIAAWQRVHDANQEDRVATIERATRTGASADMIEAVELAGDFSAPARHRRWPWVAAVVLLAAGGGAATLWRPVTLPVPLADLAPLADLTPAAAVAAPLPSPPPHPQTPPLPSPPHPRTPPPARAHPVTPPHPPATGPGQLILEANPWCQVTIDGEDRGPTPLLLTLSPGAHKVLLRNDEFAIARETVIVIPPGETVKRRFDFPRQ